MRQADNGATYEHARKDETGLPRRTLVMGGFLAVLAVPARLAYWPEEAFAQACCGGEGGAVGGGNQGSPPGGDGGGMGAGDDVGTVSGVQTGGAQDVSAMMGDQGERVIVIDVRPRADYLTGHLKNAKNVEVRYSPVLRDYVFDGSILGGDKSARIIVYGANANDPATAAVVRQATAQGFSNVIWMRGGFAEWIQARLPVVSG
jgi:rhodanese-related sulfurtransferase